MGCMGLRVISQTFDQMGHLQPCFLLHFSFSLTTVFFFYHNHYWRINFINIMSWKVRLYSSAAVFVMSNRRHGSLCSPWNFSISQSPQLENYECHQNDRICYLGLAGHNSVPDLRVRLMPMTETGDRCFMKRII